MIAPAGADHTPGPNFVHDLPKDRTASAGRKAATLALVRQRFTYRGQYEWRPPPSHRLGRAIPVVAVLIVLTAAAVTILFITEKDQPKSSSSTAAPSTKAPRASRAAVPSTTTEAPITSTSTPTTAPVPPAGNGNGPLLIALNPTQGAPGQTVTLTGNQFFSPSGHITVTFGSAQAPTVCPIQTACQVTVPAVPNTSGGTLVVPVTITTDAGASNAMLFTYQG